MHGWHLVPISIHTLRMEGDGLLEFFQLRFHISIHTLRVEGDQEEKRRALTAEISIHTLRVEGDWMFTPILLKR